MSRGAATEFSPGVSERNPGIAPENDSEPAKRAREIQLDSSVARFAGSQIVGIGFLGFASLHPRLYAAACFAGSLTGSRAQATRHLNKRNRKARIGVMLSQPRFNQPFIGCRQRQIVQLQRSANQNLPLLKSETWKLCDDFVETHG